MVFILYFYFSVVSFFSLKLHPTPTPFLPKRIELTAFLPSPRLTGTTLLDKMLGRCEPENPLQMMNSPGLALRGTSQGGPN